MTCFWDGILSALNAEQLKSTLKLNSKPTPAQFINCLKSYVTRTTDVLWNNQQLSAKELDENYQAVKELNINSISSGYNCSSCDPFLLLICQLFKVNIHHQFNGTNIVYNYVKSASSDTLKFASNRGHFWKK